MKHARFTYFLLAIFGITVLLVMVARALFNIFINLPSPPRSIISSTLPVKLLWQTQLADKVATSPQIVGQQVIIQGHRGIYGLDAKTGQPIWSHDLGYFTDAVFEIMGNKIIYGNKQGQVIALNVETGEPLWSHSVHNGQQSIIDILIHDKVVYVATFFTPYLEAIDLETGTTMWSSEGIITGRGTQLYWADNKLYVRVGDMHVLDPQTGTVVTTLPMGGKDSYQAQVINEHFYFTNSIRDVKDLRLIDTLKTNTQSFWRECDAFILPYVLSQDYFFGSNVCGEVYALDRLNNGIIWKYDSRLALQYQSTMATYHNQLFTLFQNGEIHALDSQTGQLQGILKTNSALNEGVAIMGSAHILSWGIVANEDLMIATFNDNNVWAFK